MTVALPIAYPIGTPVGYGSDRPRNYNYRTTTTEQSLLSEFISRKSTREAAE